MNKELVVQGCRCFEVVKLAHQLIYSNPNLAMKLLTDLKKDGVELQMAAKAAKIDCIREDKKIREEIATIEVEEEHLQHQVYSLISKKKVAEDRLRIQNRRLLEAKRNLTVAENKLKQAESELQEELQTERDFIKTAAILMVVAGVFTLGLGGLAVYGISSIVLSGIEERCRELRLHIRNCRSNVHLLTRALDSGKGAVQLFQREIQTYRSRIESNKRAVKLDQQRVEALMRERKFCIMLDDYWTEFVLLSETATEKTDRMKKLINKAMERKRYKVLRANGTVVFVQSFVEAWEEVSKKGQIISS